MADILKKDRKTETIEFMQLLDEMNLNTEEQKVILGFIQGVKLAKDMERKTNAAEAQPI